MDRKTLDHLSKKADRLAGLIHQKWILGGMKHVTPVEDLTIEVLNDFNELLRLIYHEKIGEGE